MTGKCNLDIQTILDKQFNVDFKGYSASEVDGFLDLVIQDYQVFQQNEKEMNAKLEEAERTNATLRARLIDMEGKAKAQEGASASSSNVDILKRLSRLEEEVFAQKNRE